MSDHPSGPVSPLGRPDRRIEPRRFDACHAEKKPRGALVCEQCGLVAEAGRWRAGAPPVGAIHPGLCPACQRVRQRYPAGVIRVRASFAEHRDEILRMVRQLESLEEREHPVERIQELCEEGGELVVRTRCAHIARRIASALGRRYQGAVSICYVPEQNLVQVSVGER